MSAPSPGRSRSQESTLPRQGSGLAASLVPHSRLERACQLFDEASSSQRCLMSLTALRSSPEISCSFIIGAFLGYQTVVEPGPLAIELNGAGHAEKQHLLHRPGSPMGQMNAVQRRA